MKLHLCLALICVQSISLYASDSKRTSSSSSSSSSSSASATPCSTCPLRPHLPKQPNKSVDESLHDIIFQDNTDAALGLIAADTSLQSIPLKDKDTHNYLTMQGKQNALVCAIMRLNPQIVTALFKSIADTRDHYTLANSKIPEGYTALDIAQKIESDTRNTPTLHTLQQQAREMRTTLNKYNAKPSGQPLSSLTFTWK